VATGERSAPEPNSQLKKLFLAESQFPTPQLRVVPTIAQILQAANSEPKDSCPIDAIPVPDSWAERQWQGAIAALNQLLDRAFPAKDHHPALGAINLQDATQNSSHLAKPSTPSLNPAQSQQTENLQGILLSGPATILDLERPIYATWVFALATDQMLKAYLQLPPAAFTEAHLCPNAKVVPVLADDPLSQESFCVVLTEDFGLALALGRNSSGNLNFYFSFDPEVVQQCYAALRPRLGLTSPHHLPQADKLAQRFVPQEANYHLVSQFSRWLLQFMPIEEVRPSVQPTPSFRPQPQGRVNAMTDYPANSRSALKRSSDPQTDPQTNPVSEVSSPSAGQSQGDVQLLRALAHEIRTPLATIRTLTRSLLRRRDLPPEVIYRLQAIDQECNEQIDRFGLIFQAAELETHRPPTARPLATVSLAEVFQASVPRWQEQAHQSNLKLDVQLPANMPRVVSDPAMLDQVLTSLIDRFTHNLPTGGHIQMQVTLAGSQIKLQFQTQPNAGSVSASAAPKSEPQSIGKLLMVQPETGSLSLNLAVTKNLFHALGGKLIVRQRAHGEVLTVFLPLDQGGEVYTV